MGEHPAVCSEGRASPGGNSGSVIPCSGSAAGRVFLWHRLWRDSPVSQPPHNQFPLGKCVSGGLLKYQGLNNPRGCSCNLSLQGQKGETTVVSESLVSTDWTSINGTITAAMSSTKHLQNPFASILGKSLLSYLSAALSDKFNINTTTSFTVSDFKRHTRCLVLLEHGMSPFLCGHTSCFALWAHSHKRLFTRVLSSSTAQNQTPSIGAKYT